jgi:hypothetical protein
MGFQFNHVGGGTKTRRPITLHMKYNSACVQPHCFLVTDEFGEQDVSLEELQASPPMPPAPAPLATRSRAARAATDGLATSAAPTHHTLAGVLCAGLH